MVIPPLLRDSPWIQTAMAGVIGTLALTAFEQLEWRLLGKRAVYAPASVGKRLAQRWLGRSDAPPATGYALRALYGPSLALALRAFSEGARSPLEQGLRLGLAIYLFELAAMPAAGATPPVADWPEHERWTLLLHTTAFGLATALSRSALARSNAPR
jgi:hypothetical protein